MVEEDDRIGRLKSDLDRVIGAEIAVQNPPTIAHKSLLNLNPFIAWRPKRAGAPEYFIEFHHWEACQPAYLCSEGGFPGTTRA